ncbi:MAG TPA: DNA primase [Candidatus Dojkabacteria bacterium]|mgnify:FL=1|nr:DNA primase [Candidatus Dojkabacteria bacterium]
MESSRDQIEEIKSRLDIVDVIGKYLPLKKAGKNYTAKCPFHTEKTPSFMVSPELQRYKCFGCGENGDIFTFVQKIENIDFPEALEKLAKEAGITLTRQKANTFFERLEEINRKAAIYFYKQLKEPKNIQALHYVKEERGITDESIKNFGIGYAPGGLGLLDYIQKENKYSKSELLQSGLFVEKEGKLRSKFFKRIMFPIRSSTGKVIAFTGRVLPGNEFGPKYMNSPETPIYHKKDNLYGQYESRQEARKQDLIILCEGTTDVISAHQIGVKNIVAPLGTSLTKEQLEKVSKLTKNVLFLFDSDSAGQKALERAFVLSQELSLNTYAATTAPYKDIDEMIKTDPEKFKKIISKKLDAYTYLLTQFIASRDINRYEDYQQIVSWIEKMLSNVKNPTLLHYYSQKTFKITKIEPLKRLDMTPVSHQTKNSGITSSKIATHEEDFLQQLLFQNGLYSVENLDLKFFEDERVKEIITYIKENPNATREEILKNFDDNDRIKELIENTIFSFSKEESSTQDLLNMYNTIIRDYFTRKEREYGVKIATAEETGNIKESERLLKEFQALTKEKQKYEQSSRL